MMKQEVQVQVLQLNYSLTFLTYTLTTTQCSDFAYDWEKEPGNIKDGAQAGKGKAKGESIRHASSKHKLKPNKKSSQSSRSSASPQTQPLAFVSPEDTKMEFFRAQFAINETVRAADKKKYAYILHTMYIYLYIYIYIFIYIYI